MQKLAENRGR